MSQVGLGFLPSSPLSASGLLASDDIKERFSSPSDVTFGIKFLSVRVSFLTSAPQIRLSVNEISPYFGGIPALFRRGADFFPPFSFWCAVGGWLALTCSRSRCIAATRPSSCLTPPPRESTSVRSIYYWMRTNGAGWTAKARKKWFIF